MDYFRLTFVIFCALSVACSCKETRIIFEEPVSDGDLIDLVQYIDLIPLQSGDKCVLGGSIDLFLPKDSDYILLDRNNSFIQRYSSEGLFLNDIGRKGRGPGEYLSVNNIQVQDTSLSVFSISGKVIKYSLSGEILAYDANSNLGQSAYYVNDGLLAYYNYAPDRSYRMALLSDSGREIDKYLKSTSQVLPFNHTAPVFSDLSSGGVSIIDSYNDCIYKYQDGKVEPYLCFDFGKHSISKKFFKFRNVREGAEFLANTDFALIDRYFESESIKLVSFYIVKDRAMISIYGMCHDGAWTWAFIDPDNPFYNSFRAAVGDTIICLLDPVKFDGIPEEWRNLITNKDVLKTINEDSNYVVAKIRIR